MKKMLLLVLPLFLCGCFLFERPKAVDEAAAMRRAAMENYAKNNELILGTLVEAYRSAERARVDALYAADVEAAKAKAAGSGNIVQFDTAISGMMTLESKRQQLYTDIDKKCAELRAVVEKSRTDLKIALKLDAAVEEYEKAGITSEAATNAVNGILQIVSGMQAK